MHHAPRQEMSGRRALHLQTHPKHCLFFLLMVAALLNLWHYYSYVRADTAAPTSNFQPPLPPTTAPTTPPRHVESEADREGTPFTSNKSPTSAEKRSGIDTVSYVSYADKERVAVVVKRNHSRAPVLSIPIVFLDADLPKLREARRWLAWMVEHFDRLPRFVAFVHDHGKTYHTLRERIDLIESAEPADVLMLSKKRWKDAGIARDTLKKRWPRSMDVAEKKKLDWVYRYLFGMDFSDAWYQWNMPEYRCCAEMVVSRAAIWRVGRRKLVRILREVEENIEEPWAWVMERTWENLFKYGWKEDGKEAPE